MWVTPESSTRGDPAARVQCALVADSRTAVLES
jgi:hypothetical protein